MIEKLVDTYKEIFGFKNVYFRYFTRIPTYISLVCSFIILDSLIVFLILYDLKWLMGLLFIVVIPINILLSYQKKQILINIYKCKSKAELQRILMRNFEERIIKLNINLKDNKQLDYLIEITTRREEELKPGALLGGGILIGSCGTLWVAYVSKIYEYIESIEEATLAFFLGIYIVGNIYYFIVSFKTAIYDDIKNSRYNKMRALRNLLEEYKIKQLNSKLADVI